MSIARSSTPKKICVVTTCLALMSAGIVFSAEPGGSPARQPKTDHLLEVPRHNSVAESDMAVIDAIADKNVSDIHTPAIDLWDRIRDGFAMAELDSDDVRRNEDFFVNHPKSLDRTIERSKRYLFYIVEEVERRGMPAEIALLPIIESAFDPTAYSNSHAAGIWQLIPSTGTTYGLKQNWWYDGRRDIVAATRAALDYLQNLYRMFGDWELALASYNWGEGAVGRALVKNRKNGLAVDLRNMKLPPETRNYIPKLIAIKNIISNPGAYGIELEAVPNRPYFEKVSADRHIDVRLAAWLADISIEEFKALNPAHNRPVINGDGSSTLLIPADKVEIFAENLRNHHEPLVSWQAYRTRNGDTAAMISKLYGISVRKLREVNDMGRREIRPGQILLVPGDGSSWSTDISTIGNRPPSPVPLERHFTHLVRADETLHEIAKRYKVTVEQIKAWNGNPQRLVAGDQLILKFPMTAKRTSSALPNHLVPQKKQM